MVAATPIFTPSFLLYKSATSGVVQMNHEISSEIQVLPAKSVVDYSTFGKSEFLDISSQSCGNHTPISHVLV